MTASVFGDRRWLSLGLVVFNAAAIGSAIQRERSHPISEDEKRRRREFQLYYVDLRPAGRSGVLFRSRPETAATVDIVGWPRNGMYVWGREAPDHPGWVRLVNDLWLPTQWPPLEGPQCLHPVDAETWNWPLRQYREAYTVADVSAPPDR
jgi:hypothetical protein